MLFKRLLPTSCFSMDKRKTKGAGFGLHLTKPVDAEMFEQLLNDKH